MMYTNVIVGITISRGSFVVSPLNTVPKRDSDERREITASAVESVFGYVIEMGSPRNESRNSVVY